LVQAATASTNEVMNAYIIFFPVMTEN